MTITYIISSTILILLLTIVNPIISSLVSGILLIAYAYTIMLSKQKYFDILLKKYMYILMTAFLFGFIISLFLRIQ
jgi:hypothetical protein